jgi:hypothetical protein
MQSHPRNQRPDHRAYGFGEQFARAAAPGWSDVTTSDSEPSSVVIEEGLPFVEATNFQPPSRNSTPGWRTFNPSINRAPGRVVSSPAASLCAEDSASQVYRAPLAHGTPETPRPQPPRPGGQRRTVPPPLATPRVVHKPRITFEDTVPAATPVASETVLRAKTDITKHRASRASPPVSGVTRSLVRNRSGGKERVSVKSVSSDGSTSSRRLPARFAYIANF